MRRAMDRNASVRYCAAVEQDDEGGWAGRMATQVGQRVAYFRERDKISASELSARCAALGHPLDRSVIAKLERGFRRTITLADVHVLARALGRPPIELIFPIGTAVEVEVLPGVHVAPWRAARWFGGDAALPDVPGVPDATHHAGTVGLWKQHDALLGAYEAALERAQRALVEASEVEVSDDPDDAGRERFGNLMFGAEGERETAHRSRRLLADLRRQIRDVGLLPPALPARLAFLDEPEEGNDGDDA